MIFFGGFPELVRRFPKFLFLCKRKGIFDILIQGPLIVFECEGIVSFLLDDLSRNRPLHPHCINRYNTTFKDKELQNFGNGGNLIGFLIHGDLRQNHPVFTGPGAYHMQCFFSISRIMGTS